MMFMVILNSTPYLCSIYEQGITMALNLADAQCDDLAVYLEGDFFESLCLQRADSKLVKILLQLELYDICLYAKRELNLGRLKVMKEDKAKLLNASDKVVVF